MREILFRGKREDSREWVYGYLNRHPSPVQIGDYNNPWTIHVPPADPDDNGGVYWVDPATIGQYTGLTDKNGVKIFEGDILIFIEPGIQEFDDNERFVVRWPEDEAGFFLELFYEGKTTSFEEIDKAYSVNFEVVGNVYDSLSLPGPQKEPAP